MTTMTATTKAGGTRTWAFPRRAQFIPDTRHRVEALLQTWECATETVDAAMLIVTELVTNAVQHTDASEIICTVGLRSDVVTVSVTDTGDVIHSAPVPAQPDGLEESGRGLVLVSALATDWGTCLTASSREVWARLTS
ncbi:ATP-binding protein [Streptomyces sp. ME01-18a]|uniref:ATP-binding protein n=1 Tax=Streptomyces sp. ME01-18a TaxID=3028669 RepID=UPI0029B39EBB|nr:ATP-binding protein [Streptomyces sp. ME01-18a]MDX3434328.1 ATP-binding protein [Streptomyces sp. ME01-18a]